MQNLASKILCIFVTGGARTHPTPLVCLRHWLIIINYHSLNYGVK